MYIYLLIVWTVVEPLYIDHRGKAVCFGSIGMSVYCYQDFMNGLQWYFTDGALRGKRSKWLKFGEIQIFLCPGHIVQF